MTLLGRAGGHADQVYLHLPDGLLLFKTGREQIKVEADELAQEWVAEECYPAWAQTCADTRQSPD